MSRRGLGRRRPWRAPGGRSRGWGGPTRGTVGTAQGRRVAARADPQAAPALTRWGWRESRPRYSSDVSEALGRVRRSRGGTGGSRRCRSGCPPAQVACVRPPPWSRRVPRGCPGRPATPVARRRVTPPCRGARRCRRRRRPPAARSRARAARGVVGVGVAEIDDPELLTLELQQPRPAARAAPTASAAGRGTGRPRRTPRTPGRTWARACSSTAAVAMARAVGKRRSRTPSPNQWSPWPWVTYTVVRFLPLASTRSASRSA